jgi:1-acyl-sn-glycerol-3-phosphate acyltransferase
MIMLRSILFFVFLLVMTPFYALACFTVFPFMSAAKRYDFVRGWNVTVLAVAKVLCDIKYEIKGMEHMTAMLDQPVILLSKHQSAWETIAFMAIFPKQLCYVFKRELLFVPFFGWALGMLRMIHIDRSKSSAASNSIARQGKERLAQGCWIIIHPEGTRTPVGKHLTYRKGGARLAVATGASVIPIAHNAGHVWPRNSFLKFPGTVTVSIGEAISTVGKTADEVHKEMENWIEFEMHVIDAKAYTK